MEKLIVDISPTGEVAIEAHGFKGKSCELATSPILKAVGRQTGVVKKAEYNSPGASTQLRQTN